MVIIFLWQRVMNFLLTVLHIWLKNTKTPPSAYTKHQTTLSLHKHTTKRHIYIYSIVHLYMVLRILEIFFCLLFQETTKKKFSFFF